MTLAVLVILCTLLSWLTIMAVRWATVRPVSRELGQRSLFVAAEVSAAVAGAAFPTVWLVASNLRDWFATGHSGFIIAGRLPPGVDEDDLLIVGMIVLVVRGCARFYSYLAEDDPTD